MLRCLPYLALGFSLCSSFAQGQGLQSSGGGRASLEGQRFAGIGVNYFNAFYRRLVVSTDTSYREGFQELGKYKIPFARISISGFWPTQNRLFDQNESLYFAYLDDVVEAAKQNQVGLIFSFFWADFCVPDQMGEPVSKWGDSTSKTHAYMRRFSSAVVKHYLTDPTVWGWEFGNEYNLHVDFPDPPDYRPPVQPTLGTPTSRTDADNLTTAMIAVAFREFAQEIRKSDTKRLIFTGNSIPRSSAWHQMQEKNWTQDTRKQFFEAMLAQEPSPLNSLTIHIYTDSTGKMEMGDLFLNENISLSKAIHACDSTARSLSRPLFFGEFGPKADVSMNTQKSWLGFYLPAILKDTLPLSAVWVYDFKSQEGSWNISTSNGRVWILEEIAKANLTLAKNVGRSVGIQSPRLDHKPARKNGPAWGPFYNMLGQRWKKAVAFFH